MSSSLVIPKKYFDQIMVAVGAPFVTYAPGDTAVDNYDLELNEDQIKSNILELAFEEYFIWFPIVQIEYLDVSGDFELNFPDNNTFSVTDVRMTTRTLDQGPTGNPLVDERFIYNSSGSFGRGMYGTRNDYGFAASMVKSNFEMQSWVDSNKTFSWNLLRSQKMIKGFSNSVGTLEVDWAKYSLNWDDVAFEQWIDLIDLCKGKVKLFFGELRQQMETDDVPAKLRGDALLEQGQALVDRVHEKWNGMSVPVIMKG